MAGTQTDRERAESGQRDEECRGGVWSKLEHALVHCRQTPKIEIETFFFFYFFFFFSSSTVREKPQASQNNFTAGHKPVRGSSPEMNRGDSLRRRLSSLRGTWRWSTGYLFRKVGCDRGAHGWTVGMDVDCSFPVSSLVFFPFVVEQSLRFPSKALTSPHHPLPCPPSLSPSFFLRWLIPMACL